MASTTTAPSAAALHAIQQLKRKPSRNAARTGRRSACAAVSPATSPTLSITLMAPPTDDSTSDLAVSGSGAWAKVPETPDRYTALNALPISADEKAGILGGNARSLLRI